MSALLASLAILLAPQAQEPDLSKKITFERVAMPAKRLVAELGQEAGLTLDVSQQTAAEILVVRFADVTAKEALDQIAKTVNGEWSKESGGTMRLIRSASALNKEIAAERAEKIKAVQTEIKKQIELANKKPTKEELESEEFFPSPFADRNKEVLALLSRLNAADLVMEESDSRVVFSSNPTRMQKLLPGNLTPIVNSLVAEHQKEVAEFQKSKEERDEHINEEMRQWMEMMKSMGMDRDPKPFDGVPSKLLFIVEQRDFMGITATIRIYDSKGKAIIERQGSLGMGGFMEEAMEMAKEMQNPGAKPVSAEKDEPIEFSPETKELSGLFRGMMQNPQSLKLSTALEQKLLRPDVHDPLSFSTSESLLAVAKAKNLNLVASLPDTVASMFDMFEGGEMATVNAFMAGLEESDEVKIDKSTGWMVVAPKWPNEARKKRVDRTALAKLVGAAKNKGYVSLDDMADYALTSPEPAYDSVAMTYMMLYAPSAMMEMNGMLDWNALRFYGSLAVTQRQSLASTGRIGFSSFSPLQRSLAARMLFGSNAGLKVHNPNEKPREERSFVEMAMGFMGAEHNDFRQEPTEIMPNGLPAAGYVTASVAREPVAKMVDAGSVFGYAALGSDELAMFRMFKDDPNMAAVAGMMPQINRLQMGERTHIDLKFWVAEGVLAEKSLQDNQFAKDSQIVNLDSLPPDFQARIDKRLEAFKKQPFPGFGMGRGVRPPPPL